MRLPEPKKLPSGNWRIQVLVDGKRVGRTFPTKEEAEYWAAGLKTKIMEENRSPWKMTVGAAVDRYIESKSSILLYFRTGISPHKTPSKPVSTPLEGAMI